MAEILQTTGVKLWSQDDYDLTWKQVFSELTGTTNKSNMRLIDESIKLLNDRLIGFYLKYEDEKLYICKDEDGVLSFKKEIFYSDTLKKLSENDEGTLLFNGNEIKGETDYTKLENLPSINGVTISGDLTTSDLKIDVSEFQEITISAYEKLSDEEKNNGTVYIIIDAPDEEQEVQIEVDSVLSDTSINPVQNKIIKKALDEITKELEVQKKSVSDGKKMVAAAITEKGVATNEYSDFEVLASNIRKILSGSEIHGATINGSIVNEELFGMEVSLKLNNTVVNTTTSSRNGTFCFQGILQPGEYFIEMVFENEAITNIVQISTEDVILRNDIEVDFSYDYVTLKCYANSTDYKGKDFKLYDSNDNLVTTVNSGENTYVIFNFVKQADTYYVKTISDDNIECVGSVAVSNENLVEKQTLTINMKMKCVSLRIEFDDYTDGTISLYRGSTLVKSVEDKRSSIYSFNKINVAGTYTVKYIDMVKTYEKSITVTQYNIDNSQTLESIKIDNVSCYDFYSCSLNNIGKMVKAHYDGKINIKDYWRVGEQNDSKQYVILGFEHDTLETPINGKTKAAVTIMDLDGLMHTELCYPYNVDHTVEEETNSYYSYPNSIIRTNLDSYYETYLSDLSCYLDFKKFKIKYTGNNFDYDDEKIALTFYSNISTLSVSNITGKFNTSTYIEDSDIEGAQYDYFKLNTNYQLNYHSDFYTRTHHSRTSYYSRTSDFTIFEEEDNNLTPTNNIKRHVIPIFCL